jgi:hypothetical protein
MSLRTPRVRPVGHLLLVLAIVVLTISGCGGASGAPAIPPIETFLIPLESFPSNNTSGLVSFGTGNQSNWYHAAGTIAFWRAIVTIGLAVPVAAFNESFQHTAVRRPGGSWIWSYSVNISASIYTAELHGQNITEGVHWDMRISKEGEYEDFGWYYGEHNLAATEGFWILKDSPTVPTDLLQIDWSRNISAGNYSITYTNIVPGGSENGGYIKVQYTNGIPYDYICHIYNKGDENHIYIDWSSTTGEGRIRESQHFGDDDWRCWDMDQLNVACP